MATTEAVKVRQVNRLPQLPAPLRLELISSGIKALARYARLLLGQAEAAHAHAPMAAELTGALASELGAKAMILLDYVRPPAGVTPQLPFYRHEAAEVYEWYYRTHHDTFGEVQRLVAAMLAPTYVEGDEHLIFDVASNEMKLHRESRLYPDLMEEGGELKWQTPAMRMVLPSFGVPVTHCLDLVAAMEHGGFVEPAALDILGDVWGQAALTADTDADVLRAINGNFVERCFSAALATSVEMASTIINELRFPLCGTSLKVSQ